MGQVEPVKPKRALRVVGRGRVLEALDEGASATGVAGDGVHARWKVGGQNPRVDQGPKQGDGGGRVAAGVGDPLGRGDLLGLPLGHLREAIDPIGRNAVRGRCVDDPNLGALDHRHRLARRRVRQAEDHQVRGIEHIAPGLGILAPVLGQAHDLERRMTGQTVSDLQAGGAGRAVDEDSPCHGRAVSRHDRGVTP